MKQHWNEAFCEAAAVGLRFDHNEHCGRFTKISGACSCGAFAANRALGQMAKKLRTGGIVVDGNERAVTFTKPKK